MQLEQRDEHGNPVSGEPAAISRYDAALDRYLRFHPQVVDQTMTLVADVPDFAMGQALAAYLHLTSTDVPDLSGAAAAVAAMDAAMLNDREQAHRLAIGQWLAGDWRGASRRLDDVLIAWPADLLALMIGHQLDFFLGDSSNLRDRVGRTIGQVDPAHPHSGFVHGMYAFGLEECGLYDLAQAHGLQALTTNPDDVWAVHAVVHVHEMRGRVDEGIQFLRDRQSDWTNDNLFTVHNWWHLTLFLLEAGLHNEALAIYDQEVHNSQSLGVPLEMLDASALLWRFFLDGLDTGGRFGPLADAWSSRATQEPWYAFNDLHAVMAFSGAGCLADARQVINRLEGYVAGAASVPATNVTMTAEIGLPACRAVLAYAEGRDGDVLSALLPIRAALNRFGGSHAQRDALQRTALAAALRGGENAVAGALISERLGLRPSSVYALEKSAELSAARGRDDEVAAALASAERYRHQFGGAIRR